MGCNQILKTTIVTAKHVDCTATVSIHFECVSMTSSRCLLWTGPVWSMWILVQGVLGHSNECAGAAAGPSASLGRACTHEPSWPCQGQCYATKLLVLQLTSPWWYQGDLHGVGSTPVLSQLWGQWLNCPRNTPIQHTEFIITLLVLSELIIWRTAHPLETRVRTCISTGSQLIQCLTCSAVIGEDCNIYSKKTTSPGNDKLAGACGSGNLLSMSVMASISPGKYAMVYW